MRFFILIFAFILSLSSAHSQTEIHFMPRVKGKKVTYYALSKDFNSMVAFQFTLNWDPDVMKFESLKFRDDMPYGLINPKWSDKGYVLMSWFAEKLEYSRKDCDTLFTMEFTSLNGVSDIEITSDPLKKEVAGKDGLIELRSKVVSDCGLTSSEGPINKEKSIEIRPTLVAKGEKVQIIYDYEKELTVQLFDVSGKMVSERQVGPELHFNAPSVTGVYVCRILQDLNPIYSDRLLVQ